MDQVVLKRGPPAPSTVFTRLRADDTLEVGRMNCGAETRVCLLGEVSQPSVQQGNNLFLSSVR